MKALFLLLLLGGTPVYADFDFAALMNGLPGIKLENVRQHSARGIINPLGAERSERTLHGPMQIIPGEAVALSYPASWPVVAYAEGDRGKPVNKDYLDKNAFLYVSGEPQTSVVIEFKNGQRATIEKPNNPNAPANPLVTLARYQSVQGRSMAVIQNRLCAPSKVERLSDGRQAWHYRYEIVQTSQRAVTTNGQINGLLAGEFVNLNTTQQTMVAVARPLVLWDFTILFDANGFVESLSNGATGPGPWVSVVR